MATQALIPMPPHAADDISARPHSRTLTTSEARAFYDRFGAKQDKQAFYEDRAIAALIAHADFEHAQSIFEFGCGTGRLAARLLPTPLPDNCHYLGVDISTTMVALARERLRPTGQRSCSLKVRSHRSAGPVATTASSRPTSST